MEDEDIEDGNDDHDKGLCEESNAGGDVNMCNKDMCNRDRCEKLNVSVIKINMYNSKSTIFL